MTAVKVREACDNIHDALTMSESPPTNGGGKGGVSKSRPPMPTAVIDARVELKHILVSWALLISQEGQFVVDCEDEAMSITGWIYQKADWLGNHDAVDDFLEEVGKSVQIIRYLYRGRDERLFCGIHAGHAIYANPGQTTVVLPDGSVERVEVLREEMRGQMSEVIDTAGNVAAIIRTYFGAQVTAKRIRKAEEDDRLSPRMDRLEPAAMDGKVRLFRVSDVLTRLGVSSAQTRAVG